MSLSDRNDVLNFLTPITITILYGVLGSIWILFSDRLVIAIADTQQELSLLQTTKGWIYIVGSAIFIYSLIKTRELSLNTYKKRLEISNQKQQVYSRIIRHNLRNQINTILLETETLKEIINKNFSKKPKDKRDKNQIQKQLDKIIEKINKIERITEKTQKAEQLPETIDKKNIDLKQTIKNTTESLKQKHPDVNFILHLEDLKVLGNETIDFVLEEIIENGIEYNDQKDKYIQIKTRTKDKNWIEIEITDNGTGIPKEELEPITKGEETSLSHGSGLGLWMSYWMVEKVNGEIYFKQNKTKGTTVTMILPRNKYIYKKTKIKQTIQTQT